MTVTVCLPTYNRAEMVCLALDSILRQTYRDLRVLVLDDGSTDNTQDRLRDYLRIQPQADRERVTLHRFPRNQGHGAARRWFADQVDTELAAWQDSDDWSCPDRLAKQVAELERTGAAVCFCDIGWWTRDPRCTRTFRRIDPSLWNRHVRSINNRTNTATGVFRRPVLELLRQQPPIDHGGYDTVWTYAIIAGEHPVAYVPEALYRARRHLGRLTQRRGNPAFATLRAREQVLIWDALHALGARGLGPRPEAA